MKQAKAVATSCAIALGLFLGILVFNVVVRHDLSRGIGAGIIASCLFLLVRGVIALVRRNRQLPHGPSPGADSRL